MKIKVNQSHLKSQLESALLVATLALTQSGCNAISIEGNVNDGQDAGIQAPTLGQSRSLSGYGRAMIAEGAQVYQGMVVSQLASSPARSGLMAHHARTVARISNQTVTHNSFESALNERESADGVAEGPVTVDPDHLGCALWFRTEQSPQGGFQGGLLDCTAGRGLAVTNLQTYLNLRMDSGGRISASYSHNDMSYHVSTAGAQVAQFNDGLYHYLQATVIARGQDVDIQLYVDNHGPYLTRLEQAPALNQALIETQHQAIFSGADDIENLLHRAEEHLSRGRAEFADALDAEIDRGSDSSAFCREHLGYAAGNNWNVRLYSDSDCRSLGGNWVGNGECLDPMGGSFSAANAIYNSACPGLAPESRRALVHFENESCIGVASGGVRLFTRHECINELHGNYIANGAAWGVSANLGECLVIGGGSYSAILGKINQRCSQN